MKPFVFTHMDYLTMSYRKVGSVYDLISQAYTPFRIVGEMKPAPMYQEAYRLQCGAVANLSWDEHQGAKIDIGGEALWNIRGASGWTDEYIVNALSESPAKKRTTRLDFAFNIVGAARVHLLHWYVRKGKYDGNIKIAPSVYTPNSKTSQTLYFGSKASDFRVRVYDKGHEMGMLSLAWARCEAQARGEYAQNAVIDAGNGTSIESHFRTRIYKSMGNIRLRWWRQMMEGETTKIKSLIKKDSDFLRRMEQIEAELMKKAENPEHKAYIAEWAANLALRLTEGG